MTHDQEVKVRLSEKDFELLARKAEEQGMPKAVLARSFIRLALQALKSASRPDEHRTD